MTAIDAGWHSENPTSSDCAALIGLRRAVLDGVCRIGVRTAVDAPCLMRLIMDAVPHGPSRDRLVDAIAGRLPGAAMDRPQLRMMRYCRTDGASRAVVLKAIDAVLVEMAGSMIELPLPLWHRRLLRALR